MVTEPLSDVYGDPGWMDVDSISHHVQILPEKPLRQIAKGALAKFTLGCEENGKVTRVWQSLLQTYSMPSSTHSHISASCNAVSVFLENAILSKNEGTRRLVHSRQTWMTIFDVFRDRFDDGKSKSMRQVLVSLVKVLKHDGTDAQFIRSQFVDAIIPSIFLRGTRSQLKASLVSIEVFTRRNAILPTELISLFDNWLVKNPKLWTPLFQDDCNALSIDISQYINGDRGGSQNGRAMQVAATIFVLGLASWGKSMDSASTAGSALAVFFESNLRLEDAEAQNLSSAWVTPVRHVMLQNMGSLEAMSNQVLYPLFKIDPHGFNCFINTLPFESSFAGDVVDAPLPELILLFSALQTGKKIGIVHEDYSSAKASLSNEPLVLKSEVVGQFLLHRESSIRSAALSLLVSAPSTTKPVTSASAWAILRGLPSMHAESDAFSRGEILSLTRKLITRIKAGIFEDQAATKLENAQQLAHPRQEAETKKFLNAYVDFLRADLRPAVSYPRHITALRALALFLESGVDTRIDSTITWSKPGENNPSKFTVEIFSSNLLRLLVDLLLDSFEDVRATSLSILEIFPRDILIDGQTADRLSSSGLTGALSRAEQLASNTSRADHADTVARLYHLLFRTALPSRSDKSELLWWETKAGVVDTILGQLEAKLSTPGGLFTSSLRDAPLHGFLSALRYIVMTPAFHSSISDQDSQRWRSVHDRLVSLCDKIWLEVKPVLCVDSPEGHSDEPIEDLAVGPKDILSYSWRALRESSVLLHATLSNGTYGPKGEHGLMRVDYERVGTLSFIQLAELRHRGAFSTVAQTFTTCCQRCGESKDPSISSLPEAWYEEVRKLIFEAASKLTRRSAGLPALVTGIISSNPGGPLFQRVMNDLHEISCLPEQHDKTSQEVELPQVHAMNCLKDIFVSNRMGPQSESFIERALNLSADRMGSPLWSLRNCGLMLFRSLLSRISRVIPGVRLGFGGNSGAEPGAKISFLKYPGLVSLLSSLLSPSQNTCDAETESSEIVTARVFPALELIGQKIPGSRSVDDSLLRQLVTQQLKSPVWAIREHAARVYASLLSLSDILDDIPELLEFDRDVAAQNFLHGKALGVKYALRRLAFASDIKWEGRMHDVLTTMRKSFAVLFPSARSPFVVTVLIEILNEAVEKSIEAGVEGEMASFVDETFETYDLDDILEYLFDLSDPSWKVSSTTRASSLLRRELSKAMILRKFSSSRLDGLVDFLQTVSNFDSDAARWLLTQMPDMLGNGQHKPTLLDLYSSVVLRDHRQDVKCAAIENLASSLEFLLEVHKGDIKGIDLPCEALEKQLKTDADAHMRNRDMADAEMLLQGCLLTLKASSRRSPDITTLDKDIRKWAVKLQFAMQEETEFTTRFAAASSLAVFTRTLRPTGHPPKLHDVYLDIYLILYDMLNDDDEEIRDLAASTTSRLLSHSDVSPSKAIILDYVNSRDLLATFISQNYSTSQCLPDKILQYINGQKSRASGSVSPGKPIPVSNLISELRKESTILFVEEKQNLFIDEVCELDVWTKNLFRIADSSYDSSTIIEVCAWVSNGLSCLIELVGDEAGRDGLLGWASKPELFTLGVRVISIAAMLASKNFPASKLLGHRQDTLKEGLKALVDTGRGAALHPEWLSRAEKALEL